MNLLFLALIVAMGINLLMFIPAFMYKTDKLTDISYSITFATLAIFGFYQSSQNKLDKIILILVLIWALRLGGFLFIRINTNGKDVRFDGLRDQFFPFLKFWLLQGATVFVVMLGALLGYMQNNSIISLGTLLGIVVFLLGLTIESIADTQKFHFTSEIKNKKHWIDRGIWRSSRHPNYLGEMMVWFGIYLVVVSSLDTLGILIALLSPVYISGLLLFVSGIPPLEQSAQKKWGNQKAFKQYQKEVPILIPSLNSIKRMFV